jgi:hypothetical protein
MHTKWRVRRGEKEDIMAELENERTQREDRLEPGDELAEQDLEQVAGGGVKGTAGQGGDSND